MSPGLNRLATLSMTVLAWPMNDSAFTLNAKTMQRNCGLPPTGQNHQQSSTQRHEEETQVNAKPGGSNHGQGLSDEDSAFDLKAPDNCE